MSTVALVATLSAMAPSPSVAPWFVTPWRLVDRPDLHVGLRPAAYVGPGEIAVGVTLQVTVFWP